RGACRARDPADERLVPGDQSPSSFPPDVVALPEPCPPATVAWSCPGGRATFRYIATLVAHLPEPSGRNTARPRWTSLARRLLQPRSAPVVDRQPRQEESLP